MKSIIWLKSRIKSIDALTAKKAVAIDFYRLTNIIDINQKEIIGYYRFIDWFSDMVFIDCTSRVLDSTLKSLRRYVNIHHTMAPASEF